MVKSTGFRVGGVSSESMASMTTSDIEQIIKTETMWQTRHSVGTNCPDPLRREATCRAMMTLSNAYRELALRLGQTI